MANDYKRRGPQEKCPACGWRLDADAYRCPKCMIYFCFKCRRRVTATDPQYQCLNQQCQYYGKLLCEVCTQSEPQYEEYRQEHSEGGTWFGIAIAAWVIGIVTWMLATFLVALVATVLVFAVGCAIGKKLGWGILSETRYTLERFQRGEHKVCIGCKQLVEVLQEKKER